MATASSSCARFEPSSDVGHRDLAALQPRHPLPLLRRRAAARGLSGLDRRVDRRGARGAGARRLALPQRRRQATDPWTALDVAQAARRHLTLQNTIHWIKSIAIDRDGGRRGAGSTAIWPSATTSRSTATASSTTATSSSFTSRRDGRTPLDRRPSACRIRTRRTSRAGGAAGATCAAAATPGSSPTRRSRAATRTGRTRRRSRRGCRNSASGCTARVTASAVVDPFLGLGARQSLRAPGRRLRRHRDRRALSRGSDRTSDPRRSPPGLWSSSGRPAARIRMATRASD